MKKIIIIGLLVIVLTGCGINNNSNLDNNIIGSWYIVTPPSNPNSLEDEQHIIAFDENKNFFFENEKIGTYENGTIILNDNNVIKYSKVKDDYYLENVIHKEKGVLFVDNNVSSKMIKINE